MFADYDISLGRADDIPGILALQEMNLAERGGGLSVRQSGDWFRLAMNEKSLVVAHHENKVVGYVLGTSLAANKHVTIIQTMLRTFPSPPDCYLYGPICVTATQRGKPLAGALFEVLKTHMAGRPAMTFVRADNIASGPNKHSRAERASFMAKTYLQTLRPSSHRQNTIA